LEVFVGVGDSMHWRALVGRWIGFWLVAALASEGENWWGGGVAQLILLHQDEEVDGAEISAE